MPSLVYPNIYKIFASYFVLYSQLDIDLLRPFYFDAPTKKSFIILLEILNKKFT